MGKPIVLLDVDDTILDFHRAEAIAVAETLRRLGIEPTDRVVSRYSAINALCWEKLELGLMSRIEVMTGRFDILFSELGVYCRGAQAQAIYPKLLGIGHFFMPGAPELLESLYGRYELYIVSNGTAATQASRLKSAGILNYFSGVFISEDIGFEKPSREFFDRCFAKIEGFSRERCIIVGDSLSSDIRGGINAGIKTCWYNSRNKAPRADIIPDHEISSLSQLPPLLEVVFA